MHAREPRALVARAGAARGDAGAQLQAGSELRDGQDHVIGHVTSTALDPDGPRMLALGYVKAAHAAEGSTLRANEATLRVVAKCVA